jgi:AraC-like DNA-binding protein
MAKKKLVKNKGGRPRIEIDWESIDKLCGLQCTEEEIAQFLGISVDTLCRACQRKYNLSFAEYFGQKRGIGKVALRRAQWQVAQSGNPALLIWLGKQYLDQKDKSHQEHSGKITLEDIVAGSDQSDDDTGSAQD